MNKIKLLSLMLVMTFLGQTILAQVTFQRNGVYDEREGFYAFTNATIFKSYNEKVENATMIIKDGRVQTIGQKIPIPAGAVVVDLKGKFIYPSFIDLYSSYGVPEAKAAERSARRMQQFNSNKEGAYGWNQALKPEFRAHENFSIDKKAAKGYRDAGFGTVMTHQEDGISRGTATLVVLGEEAEHQMILKEETAHMLSFKKGTSTQSYPGSLMGGIALLRQTYMDANWYKNGGKNKELNLSLEAWNEINSLPTVFDVREKLEALRAAKLGKEFGKKYIIKGTGDEYQRLNELKATGCSMILPVKFPDAYDVEDPYDAMLVSLGQMKHWELAPTNPSRISKAGIEFTLTTNGLAKKSDFLKSVKKAIKHGLSEEDALKALTHTPAKMMGMSNQIGSLKSGSLANFIVTSENVFGEKAKIHHNWVKGKPFVLKKLDEADLEGNYSLKVGNQTFKLMVDGDNKMKVEENDSTKINVKSSISNDLITLTFSPTKKETNLFRLSGTIGEKEWSGNGTLIDGTWTSWSAKYEGAPEKKDGDKKAGKKKGKGKGKGKKDKMASDDKLGDVIYPFMAHGYKERPTDDDYLIKNATVWTNEKDGILENTDVLVRNGKVVEIGKNINKDIGTRIDGTGMHLTCGVIDEHSHIAISRGVNECTEVSTAEVSIADVVDSEDIDIYRQLAGGVTTSQLLHGSCNPIGGQSAIIKLRWGFAPEEMKFEDAPGFIKFALGENVKKSRSSSNNRFPDTRMGVEQVYRDYFTRAKEYKIASQRKEAGFRRDLDMETVVEILDGKRHISCHSYVQSEINMLMHVADEMDFKVNTFTHILEGYKVADKMAKHGAGGSTFSDWWAYKYEVVDAIPYNAAIMHEQGVTTAINSDDAEMARRLNQEAAKAVMYGGVSEEDAWKFVTLNPAKLLHIDHKVGSIKEGKDADLVLWNANPLSVYARAEMTFVDGLKLFDRKQDVEIRKEIAAERNRLIQKMLAAKKGGSKTRPARGKKSRHYHCDDSEDEMID
jgi:imidazolonepropionase-like amidohydrolase